MEQINLKEFLKVCAARGREVIFRCGEKGRWYQITGARFLDDIDYITGFIPPEQNQHYSITDKSYTSIVLAMSLIFQGHQVSFFQDPQATLATSLLPKNYESLGMRRKYLKTHIWEKIYDISKNNGSFIFQQNNTQNKISFQNLLNAVTYFNQKINFQSNQDPIRMISFKSESHIFYHTGWLLSLLEGGVFGFMDPKATWETNLRVLRANCIIASGNDIKKLSDSYLVLQKEKQLLGERIFQKIIHQFGVRGMPLMKEAFEDLSYVIIEAESSKMADESTLNQYGIETIRISTQKILKNAS